MPRVHHDVYGVHNRRCVCAQHNEDPDVDDPQDRRDVCSWDLVPGTTRIRAST